MYIEGLSSFRAQTMVRLHLVDEWDKSFEIRTFNWMCIFNSTGATFEWHIMSLVVYSFVIRRFLIKCGIPISISPMHVSHPFIRSHNPTLSFGSNPMDRYYTIRGIREWFLEMRVAARVTPIDTMHRLSISRQCILRIFQSIDGCHVYDESREMAIGQSKL